LTKDGNSRNGIADVAEKEFDEDAALEAMWEKLAAPHPRDILKREHERELNGYPRDIALEKRGPEIEEMIARDLELMNEGNEKGTQVLLSKKPDPTK